MLLIQLCLGILASCTCALYPPPQGSLANVKRENNIRLLPKRSTIHSCRNDKEAIDTASNEAVSILSAAAKRLQGLNKYITMNPLPDIRTQSSSGLVSTFRTFSSIIDKHLGVGNEKEREPGIARVQLLTTLAQTIADNLESAKFDVYCGDDYLSAWNNIKREAKPGFLWDNRHFVSQKSGSWIEMKKPFDGDENRQPKSFTLSGFSNQLEPDLLAINPQSFKDDTWKFQNVGGENYTAMRGQAYKDKDWHINSVLNNHLTSAMIQMFSVLQSVATEDLVLKDRGCLELSMGSFQDEWSCITAGAETSPEQSSQNSLHFKYLMVALFLNKNDWSTGWSRAVSDARKD